MAYQLGNVAPHVRAAADHFGRAHNISTIGGWRARGSVPGSDHPKGLALDYMTRSKPVGDALARDLIENAQAWNVKYVIWWRQIWHPGRGWKPYSGPSAHTDHVHASFGDKPGKGGGKPLNPSPISSVLDPLGVAGAIKNVGDRLGEIGQSAAKIGTVADLLTRAFLPTNMVRGAAGFAGAIFVLIGIWFLSREIRNS